MNGLLFLITYAAIVAAAFRITAWSLARLDRRWLQQSRADTASNTAAVSARTNPEPPPSSSLRRLGLPTG